MPNGSEAPNLSISNNITQSYSAYSDAATNKDGASEKDKKGGVYVFSLAASWNDINNTAQTSLDVGSSVGSSTSPWVQ